ncbi:MAG: hypothetical protein LQ346_000324 [Caloplaca aetnensis]|nr:MAG: hypothetical protein LQ346_000324 [Caloplaca aetnensis]
MPRYDTRTASAPVTPFTTPITSPNISTSTQNRLSSVSALNLSNAFTPQQNVSKDDSSISAPGLNTNQRPLSAIDLNSTNPSSSTNSGKPTPDRYKRNHRRVETAGLPSSSTQKSGGSALPSGSGMATIGHLYNGGYQTTSTPTLTSYPSYRGSPPPSRQINDLPGNQPKKARREAASPHASSGTSALQATSAIKHEPQLINIPPRGSSDASKRLTNPSPLSKPINMGPESPSTKNAFAAVVQQKPNPAAAPSLTPNPSAPDSPAAQHLAALNKKEGKKEGKSSRLRRAFSFGSAAELRKASAENNMSTERAKLRKDRYQDEADAEQAAIAQKQEAGGLGAGIYSGQGHFFTGSTDNLSISSTASSASVMIRKMGKGVKKGSRSLVGLFRPKSVVGVPAADGPVPEASVAQVSMVTVEAEREKVNVNADPHDQAGGGTGFPKLERNSVDAARAGFDQPASVRERSMESARPRRSIVGGEKERAEVLAAVKKGILKRNGTSSGNSSPVVRPADWRSDSGAPQLPHFGDSPASSSPSTPVDDRRGNGHRKTDSIAIEGEDYFMSLAKYASGEENVVPGTPRSLMARNISFSPHLQFHDTWASGEYDRRGEIATCNRLTPMLAQQIKEELNTFKMEMEIHKESERNTHYF